jgi:hypothetical protein
MTFRFGDSIEPASMAGGAVLEDLWRAISFDAFSKFLWRTSKYRIGRGLTKGKGNVELNWTRFW